MSRFALTIFLVALVDALSYEHSVAQEKDVEKRVKELLVVLAHPEARSSKLQQSQKAVAELKRIGAPAAPLLVEALFTPNPPAYVELVLKEIGKPALAAVTAQWGSLTDSQRWKLMPFREKYDAENVRDYGFNSLSIDDPKLRQQAWGFIYRSKDPRAKDRFLNGLKGLSREMGGEDHSLRWYALLSEEPWYDAKRENEILIRLLDPDSWAAKGEGQLLPPGIPPPWWPDGRPHVIRILHERKIAEAAPALLKILQEKGAGKGYLVEAIIPALVDFKYKAALEELASIAASKPVPEGTHPYALITVERVQELATDAIARLRERKP